MPGQTTISDFSESKTRLIAMGNRPLMEGFSLLGFETWPNASSEDLDKLLIELLKSDQKAVLLLETHLSQSQSSILTKVRTHGGKILVTEVPAINASHEFHPYVEDLVIQVLGKNALENEL
jgi:vacuolar-type H+-ATPase subunit F/Vma7